MKSCIKKTRRFLSVVKALISRCLFVLHGLFCIWRVTVVKRDAIFWSLSGTIPFLVFETVFTLCKKKGREWKWVCPSVVLYLATAIPAIWFLELDLMAQRLRVHGATRRPIKNNTIDVLILNGKVINIAIALGSEEWCKILEQMLLLILIIGRWLLPKGEITREQLSQLLLVYIGMAADIIELFEAFKEKTVRENQLLTIVILSLWTASLMQFTLVVTATKSKKSRASVAVQVSGEGCCPVEVISIFISVLLQDGPFLVLRMLLIFRYDVLSYTNIFFTCKNSLVLVLQMYRLFVLFTERRKNPAIFSPTPPSLPSRYSDTADDAVTSYSSDATPSDGTDSDDQNEGRSRRHRKRQPTAAGSARTLSSGLDVLDTAHCQDLDRRSLKTPTPKLKHHAGVSHRTGSDQERDAGKPQRLRKGNKEDHQMMAEDEEMYTERMRKKGKPGDKIRDERKGEVKKKVKQIENQVRNVRETMSSNSDEEEDYCGDYLGSSHDVTAASDQDRRRRLKAKSKSSAKGHHVTSSPDKSGQHRDKRKGQGKGQDHWKLAERDIRTALSFLNETGQHKTRAVQRDSDQHGVYVIDDDDDDH